MDCELIQGQLIAYHLGDGDERVDEHLGECLICVRAYLAVKRAMRASVDDGDLRPSAALKQRLRESVAQETARSRSAWKWGGVAAAAVAAAAVAVGLWQYEPSLPPIEATVIDSARPVALNTL